MPIKAYTLIRDGKQKEVICNSNKLNEYLSEGYEVLNGTEWIRERIVAGSAGQTHQVCEQQSSQRLPSSHEQPKVAKKVG